MSEPPAATLSSSEAEVDFPESDGGWRAWFCALEDHEFYAEIDEDYIRDPFNSFGLRNKVPMFDEALRMILDPEPPSERDFQDDNFLEVYKSATDLYGLLHSRFILTPHGLTIMREKYLTGAFGTCPRVLCERQNLLPVGMSDELRTSRVKVFCPKCEESYYPKKKLEDVDGSFFGTSFPHILLQSFDDLQGIPVGKVVKPYEPAIYGFKIVGHRGSRVKEPIL